MPAALLSVSRTKRRKTSCICSSVHLHFERQYPTGSFLELTSHKLPLSWQEIPQPFFPPIPITKQYFLHFIWPYLWCLLSLWWLYIPIFCWNTRPKLAMPALYPCSYNQPASEATGSSFWSSLVVSRNLTKCSLITSFLEAEGWVFNMTMAKLVQ